MWIYEYTYDNASNLASYRSYYKEPTNVNDPNSDTHTLVFDDQGRIISDSFDALKNTYEYRDDGKLQEGGDGSSYVYDDQGRLTSCEAGTGSNKQQIFFNYDDQGRVTSFDTGNNSYLYHGAITYDDQGRVASVGPSAYNTISTSATYSYDEQGRLTGAEGKEDYSSANRSWGIRTTISYDEQGNVIQIQSYSDPQTSSTAELPSILTTNISRERYFIPEDKVEKLDNVVVEPDCAFNGSEELIQAYVLHPEIVRADPNLPIAFDCAYYDQNDRQ